MFVMYISLVGNLLSHLTLLLLNADMSWLGGPNRDEDTGELPPDEDDTQELLKGEYFRISFKMAMGGVYSQTMRAL